MMQSVKSNGIVRIIKNNWPLVTVVMLIGSIISTYFISQAALKDSIDVKIEKNDTLDCDRFIKKDEFAILKTKVELLTEKVDEIKSDGKETKRDVAETKELLMQIKTMLKNMDSL
jgi:peptidoglycan hydrolase CwlO-like protein